jgi:hypothetical protein
MRSTVTSFSGLFDIAHDNGPAIDRVKIPLIQRDYAQGRSGEVIRLIRADFLDALHAAATGGERLPLDFVYGEVKAGTLEPLDGQQRLTTLFLLHWYVASRTNHLDGEAWTQFSYATRPSAALFCKRLAQHRLPDDITTPSEWIRNQSWCLYLWRHDPTIQAMLVTLDAINDRFAEDDLDSVWARLTDPDKPGIYFHLLLIDDMGSAADLYIKMNSRGKALTPFENFKALLEKAIDDSPRALEFAERVDGVWADVMWRIRDTDNLFDVQYLNYLRYIVDVCEWRQGQPGQIGASLIARAERAFASGEPTDDDNLAFLFDAMDAWHDVDTNDYFADLFTTAAAANGDKPAKVVLFGNTAIDINLFRACCYTSFFGAQRSLLLYAVLLHRIHTTPDLSRRLRVVRNLIEASTNEIRADRMPDLFADVERIIVAGNLAAVGSFNTNQRDDEIAKREFRTARPSLEQAVFRLEDHPHLRGCLLAIELDPANFDGRAQAFSAVFDDTRGTDELRPALLATGTYHRRFGSYKLRLGSVGQTAQWRELLAGDAPSRAKLAVTRSTLGAVLDSVAGSPAPVRDRLRQISDEWLHRQEAERRFGWRYYLAKYPEMRLGASGVYAAPGDNLSFSLCMLEGTGMNGYYRDPFLYAVAIAADAAAHVTGTIEHRPDGPWFTGSVRAERWMRVYGSDVEIRCISEGFAVTAPTSGVDRTTFERLVTAHGLIQTDSGLTLRAPQVVVDGELVDTSDRVQQGAAFLRDLLDADL